MPIFANSNGRNTVRSAFSLYSRGVSRLALASPFFSYADLLRDIPECTIHLVVRLSAATSPSELKKVMAFSNAQVRYYTSQLFHSKLYLFGDTCALVGSANLTQQGMQSNREVTISVPQGHSDFDELVALFESYWAGANVLNDKRLREYEKLHAMSPAVASRETELDRAIVDTFGDIVPLQGIQLNQNTVSSDKTYLESYRRTYQDFLNAYREVYSIYQGDQRRQQPQLPLRIEFDQFLSFVREQAPGDSYKQAPSRELNERRAFLGILLTKWFEQRWEWLDDHVMESFPRIQDRFGTPQSIAKCSMEEIIEALEVCHSFGEQYRYHSGGTARLRLEFQQSNDLNHVKESITYLLHGNDDFVERMGTVIFDPRYKMTKIGRSVAQELLGWVNSDDIPICNSRTMKALRYIGFSQFE